MPAHKCKATFLPQARRVQFWRVESTANDAVFGPGRSPQKIDNGAQTAAIIFAKMTFFRQAGCEQEKGL